jgi:hypothetical protein
MECCEYCRTAKNDLVYEIRVPEPVVRMQNFVTELFENIQHFLSCLCSNIGTDNALPVPYVLNVKSAKFITK